MARYMVLHTLKKSAVEVSKALTEGAVESARAMAAGQTPAKCLFTWNPIPYGRTDYMFCLWEADRLEDIEAMLEHSRDHLTADIIQVDETDWAQVAQLAV